MNGTINRSGDIEIRWNMQEEKLYSPDGSKHLLPCERCGLPQWASLPVVSILCDRCASVLSEDLGEYGAAVAAGEMSTEEAIAACVGPRPW